MKKMIKWFLVFTATLSSLPTFAKESADVQLKRALSEIPVKVAELHPSERRARLLNFFNNIQKTNLTNSKEYKKMTKEQKLRLLESNARMKELAAHYKSAMLRDSTLDPVLVAQTFADETEQAGVIVILLALAAGALLTLGILAKIIDDAFDDVDCWGMYCY